MKIAVMLTTGLTIAALLATSLSSAAEEKTAAAKSAASAEAAPVNAAEVPPVKAAAGSPAKAAAVELLDINSASAVQLEKVPGIGAESAKKIIAGRPYFKKDQLKSRKILTAAQYYKIKDRIIARRPKVAAKTGRTR